MIKIERRLTIKAQNAMKSLEDAKKRNSTYNTWEVNEALREMFYSKCYICENKESTSYQIEHLIPHRGNVDLKYDWNNIFLACAHCNNTKLGKYDPIINCTEENVDKMIAFRKRGYFGKEEILEFEILESKKEIQNTVKLLREVYYGFTPQKRFEARVLRRTLRKEISKFKEYVREYQDAEDQEKEDLLYLIEKELKNSSPFTAFKRWLIRDNKDFYPELEFLIR